MPKEVSRSLNAPTSNNKRFWYEARESAGQLDVTQETGSSKTQSCLSKNKFEVEVVMGVESCALFQPCGWTESTITSRYNGQPDGQLSQTRTNQGERGLQIPGRVWAWIEVAVIKLKTLPPATQEASVAPVVYHEPYDAGCSSRLRDEKSRS